MVQQVKQSALAKKLGAKFVNAVNDHKDDPVPVSKSVGELPHVAFKGTAEVTHCKIGEYATGERKGESFYQAMAVIQAPETVTDKDGKVHKVQGLYTSFGPEPICDTKWPSGELQPLDEHIKIIMDEFHKMGFVDVGPDDFESTCDAILAIAPVIKFHTWISKSDKLRQDWDGLATDEDAAPVDTSGGVQDNSGADASNSSGDDTSGVPFGDAWDDIAVDASNEDETISTPAQDTLIKKGLELGYTQDQINNSESWAQVAEWIRTGESSGGDSSTGSEELDFDTLGDSADEEFATGEGEFCGHVRRLAEPLGVDPDAFSTWREVTDAIKAASPEDASAEEPWSPKVDDIYKYAATVMDPKLKKMVKEKKPGEYIVLTVVGETVTLKSLTTNKPVMNAATKKPLSVPWSELIAD